jgi:hypothetical protein
MANCCPSWGLYSFLLLLWFFPGSPKLYSVHLEHRLGNTNSLITLDVRSPEEACVPHLSAQAERKRLWKLGSGSSAKNSCPASAAPAKKKENLSLKETPLQYGHYCSVPVCLCREQEFTLTSLRNGWRKILLSSHVEKAIKWLHPELFLKIWITNVPELDNLNIREHLSDTLVGNSQACYNLMLIWNADPLLKSVCLPRVQ